MPTKRPGSKRVRQIYWPRCGVCQFMKKNPMFRYKIMNSTYFKPEGNQPLTEVLREFGEPFPITNLYMHMQRHQAEDLMMARKKYKEVAAQDPDNVAHVAAAIEGEVTSQSEHERVLDAFIKEGHARLVRKEINISATNLLAAIKIKSDNEKSTKDRRLEAIKTFFTSKKDETKAV